MQGSQTAPRPVRRARLLAAAVALVTALAACSSAPLVPFSADTPPLTLLPIGGAPVIDKRARFREIYCAVLEERRDLPDHRPCEEALTRVGQEAAGSGRPVNLSMSQKHLIAAVVPGVGFECVEPWLESPESVTEHLRPLGYDGLFIKVDALSSTANNAHQIRDAVMAMNVDPTSARLVLIGYSKGAPDILEAVVSYPEIRSRVAAVVSIAGAVGGSPLANEATQAQADMFRHFPRASCGSGDAGAIASLRPAERRAWLASHPLPTELPYYSLATFPSPDRISSVLKSGYRKLARIDPRNDGQLIFYDQLIPGSVLLGYLNADHWAAALPIARSHGVIGTTLVTDNDYPREALVEAILRFIEEDRSGS